MYKSDTPIALCPHLTVPSPDEYFAWFTGNGADYYWVCGWCAKEFPKLPESMVNATSQLVQNCQNEATWEGICGVPLIKSRATTLSFEHWKSGALPSRACWIDLQPCTLSKDWFVLLSSGDLGVLRPREGQLEIVHRPSEIGFALDGETAICISQCQNFASVYQTSGRQACVVELSTGNITARIDRGEYRPENSHFPIAFSRLNEQTLLVAATNWNRLDLIDPITGAILTERQLPRSERDEPRSERHLDYFHARLSVSPDCSWISDTGWHWGPFGVVRTWNLQNWRHNQWESENGPSLRRTNGKHYYWDGPLCWIDDSTFATWGWGYDDEWLMPAVHLFDVSTGDEIGWFPGPESRTSNAWPPKKQCISLCFDQYLFSVGQNSGTEVWDVTSGERLHHDPTLRPIQYHPISKEFLSLTPGGVCLSRLRT